MARVLLTFTGFHDPFSKGLVGDDEQFGPTLSLLAVVQFDTVVLLATPATGEQTSRTSAEIRARHPSARVLIRDLPLSDPTDYRSILGCLRGSASTAQNEFPGAAFFVSVASPPQMHAAWLLLVAGGEIPAKLLHVRPPRFVTKDRPLVSQIDVAAEAFPAVRARISAIADTETAEMRDHASLIRQLNIVADHPAVRKALDITQALADSSVPILIRGETGTDKELFARLVHAASGRSRDRFVPVNCAAIPEDLVESVLFGHRRGAFTGAIQDQRGKFDLADGGTLFLR